MIYKYKIGQIVHVVAAPLRSSAAGAYEVIALRPADSDEPHYRIKSRSEAYERVVAESSLAPSGDLSPD